MTGRALLGVSFLSDIVPASNGRSRRGSKVSCGSDHSGWTSSPADAFAWTGRPCSASCRSGCGSGASRPTPRGRVTVASNLLVIRGPDLTVLIQAGPGGSSLAPALALHGVAAEEVTALVVSNLHVDHAGGRRDPRRGASPVRSRGHASSSRRPRSSAHAVPRRGSAGPTARSASSRTPRPAALTAVSGEAAVRPGITVVPLPGHRRASRRCESSPGDKRPSTSATRSRPRPTCRCRGAWSTTATRSRSSPTRSGCWIAPRRNAGSACSSAIRTSRGERSSTRSTGSAACTWCSRTRRRDLPRPHLKAAAATNTLQVRAGGRVLLGRASVDQPDQRRAAARDPKLERLESARPGPRRRSGLEARVALGARIDGALSATDHV